MKIVLAGSMEVLSGDATDIVGAMRARAFGVDHLSLGDYIDWIVLQTKERVGVNLVVDGRTSPERATSLLEALVAHGLAERVD